MASPQQRAQFILDFLVDQANKQAALKAIKEIEEGNKKSASEGEKAYESLAGAINQNTIALQQNAQAAKGLQSSYKPLATSVSAPFESGREAVKKLDLSLDDIPSKLRSIRREAEQTGNSLDSIGDVSDTVTTGGGSRAGGIAQATGAGLSTVAGALGQIDGLSTPAVNALADVGGAVASLSPVGVAAAAATFALVLAIDALNKSVAENQQIVRDADNAYQELDELLRNGLTTEGLQEELDKRNRQLEDERERVARLNEQRAQIQAQLDQNPILSIAAGLRNDLGVFGELIDEAETNIGSLESSIRIFSAAMGSAEIAANDLAEAQDKMREAAKQAANIIKRRAEEEANYAQQVSDTLQDRFIRTQNTVEDFLDRAEQADQRHRNNLENIRKQSNARIEKLESELNDLPGERRDALVKAEAESLEERNKAFRDYSRKAIQDLEDFQRREAQLRRDANIRQLRLQEDFQDDLNDTRSNNDIEAFLRTQRDGIKAIVRDAEDAGNAASDRASNFEAEQEQNRANFEVRLADMQAALEKERQAINESFIQRRADLQAQVEAEQQAYLDRVAAAQEAERQRQELANEAFQKQLERQQEQDAIADKRRDRNHQERMDDLNAEYQNILTTTIATAGMTVATGLFAGATNIAINAMNAFVGAAQAAVVKAQAAAAFAQNVSAGGINARTGQTGGGSSSSGGAAGGYGSFLDNLRRRFGGSSGGSSSFTPTGFASGGVVTKPTLALLGEGGRPEAVVPFEPSRGLAPELSDLYARMGPARGSVGRSPISVHIQDDRTFVLADLASKAEVAEVINESNEHMITQFAAGLEKAKYGKTQVA